MESVWSKEMLLLVRLVRAVRSGGLTPAERAELAQQFGTSEDVILRYERARSAYNTLIFDKQDREARMEAMIRWRDSGEPWDPEKFAEAWEAAFERIRDEAPPNEITRELDEAVAALRAALGVPNDETG